MGRQAREGIQVAPIKLNAVNRCALSAHTRPLIINLSNVDICASRALSAAARNRRTFSCGVSPTGPGVRCGNVFEGMFTAEGGLADACGVVGVKRVASVAERGMMTGVNGFGPGGGNGEGWLWFGISHLSEAGHQEIFLRFDDPSILASCSGKTRPRGWSLDITSINFKLILLVTNKHLVNIWDLFTLPMAGDPKFRRQSLGF